jgi:hypothetical protein
MALLLALQVPACVLALGDFQLEPAPEGSCSPLAFGACGAGKKCSVIDPATGATGCMGAGPRPAWASCLGDQNCVEGTYCTVDGVCNPICSSAGDCTNGGWCVDAYAPDWVQVPGLTVCLADCQPLTGAPCDAAFGPVTCALWAQEDEFTCYGSAGSSEGAACDPQVTECGAGLVCVDIEPRVCRRWCTPVGQAANCVGGQTCWGYGPPVVHDGTEYGYCG